ncbi:MAG: hypothetical protein PVF37_16765, partial [Desulfobacterales bacterium]
PVAFLSDLFSTGRHKRHYMLDDNSYGFEAYYQFQRAPFLIELSSSDVMATIVSGGVSGVNSNA